MQLWLKSCLLNSEQQLPPPPPNQIDGAKLQTNSPIEKLFRDKIAIVRLALLSSLVTVAFRSSYWCLNCLSESHESLSVDAKHIVSYQSLSTKVSSLWVFMNSSKQMFWVFYVDATPNILTDPLKGITATAAFVDQSLGSKSGSVPEKEFCKAK